MEDISNIPAKSIFFSADHHFNHENIIKYCSRPFANSAEMDKQMLKNWNEIVKKKDRVYYVGDFYLGKKEGFYYLTSKLHGQFVFIRGSHDRKSPFMKKNEILIYKKFKFYLVHNPKYIPPNWDGWTIHGHIHKNACYLYPFIDGIKKTINVCVELTNYKPISLDFLLSLDINSIEEKRIINSITIRKS